MMEKNQRIAISQVQVGSGNEVNVELNYAGNKYQGRALCGKDESTQLIAATQALISAINSIIPTPIVTRVAEIQHVQFKDLSEPVIVTLVAVQIRGQEMLFPGTAKTNGSPINAVVRATLDAINRPIGLIL